MKFLLLAFLGILISGGFGTQVHAGPKLVPSKILEDRKDIEGPVAGFKVDSYDVRIWVPKGNTRPPVMIYAHGGSGYRSSDESRVSLFRRRGFVTISFDAYLANGFSDWRWVNRNLTLGAKQKMIFRLFKEAYAYALMQKGWNVESIWLYGQSNGARVVLAAQSDRQAFPKIRGVLAEGPPHAPMPITSCTAPIIIFYGEEDNWGPIDDLMFNRHQMFAMPDGPSVKHPSMKSWVSLQSKNGCPISLKIYKNAGHSFHSGYWLDSIWRFGKLNYFGADEDALKAYISDIDKFIAVHK